MCIGLVFNIVFIFLACIAHVLGITLYRNGHILSVLFILFLQYGSLACTRGVELVVNSLVWHMCLAFLCTDVSIRPFFFHRLMLLIFLLFTSFQFCNTYGNLTL